MSKRTLVSSFVYQSWLGGNLKPVKSNGSIILNLKRVGGRGQGLVHMALALTSNSQYMTRTHQVITTHKCNLFHYSSVFPFSFLHQFLRPYPQQTQRPRKDVGRELSGARRVRGVCSKPVLGVHQGDKTWRITHRHLSLLFPMFSSLRYLMLARARSGSGKVDIDYPPHSSAPVLSQTLTANIFQGHIGDLSHVFHIPGIYIKKEPYHNITRLIKVPMQIPTTSTNALPSVG